MEDESEKEARDHRRLAFLLFKKAGERKFTPIEADKATALLAEIEHVPMGQGSFNLLVPKEALVQAGVDTDTWRKAQLGEVQYKGKDCFEVPAMLGDLGVLPVLKILSQGVTQEMAQIERGLNRDSSEGPGRR